MMWLIHALLVGVLAEARDVLPRYRDNNGCYVEVGRGLRLEPTHVERYVTADTLRDCERGCDQARFACKSFSYCDNRRRENENCLLSRKDSLSLSTNDLRHFFRDLDFNYYERSYGRRCESEINSIHHTGRGCYDLRRTSERIDSRFIRRVLRTRNRSECEQECDREPLCKGFNYRFKTQGFNQYRDNCQLSYQDGSSDFDFHKDLDFDFYEKEYDSRNCHPSEPLTWEGTRNNSRDPGDFWNNNQGGHGNNYGGYGNNYGGNGNNYGGNGNNDGGQYGGNYGGGREECFRLVEKERAISEREAAGSLMARDIRECEMMCEKSWQFTCKGFSFSYYPASGLRHNCLLSDMEYRDLTGYSLVQDRNSDIYERRLYDRECAVDITSPTNPGDGGMSTVSGLRCYREPCRLDRQGGYFFCETDPSGAWDYCCRPREQCGHSEGYPLAWCYVGSIGRDQWRPCNENVRGRDFLKDRLLPGAAFSNSTTTTDAPTSTEHPGGTEHSLEVLDMF